MNALTKLLNFLLGGKIKAATFREPYSYIEMEPTDDTDWNNHMDVGNIAFEFKTTRAAGIMVYGRGPISGDFVRIEMIGRTRIRATMNLGYYKDLYVDIDIRRKNRTFDDNLFHKFALDWNRKEMNVTADNITRTMGFHFQYGISHLDMNGAPFYIGGSVDDQNGFVGCMRDFVSSYALHFGEIFRIHFNA